MRYLDVRLVARQPAAPSVNLRIDDLHFQEFPVSRKSGVSVLEAEQCLCVVMEDLVGVALWHSESLDISEGLLVGFVILQYRVVAAGHQMIGAERLQRTGEGGFRAVAHGVVPELL